VRAAVVQGRPRTDPRTRTPAARGSRTARPDILAAVMTRQVTATNQRAESVDVSPQPTVATPPRRTGRRRT
jgi:hypothetical protein